MGNRSWAPFSNDDLPQDQACQIFTAGRIDHPYSNSCADHLCDAVQVDVAAARGIVEPPVLIFPDDDASRIHALTFVSLTRMGQRVE
jgi:hypothetical protein